MGLSGRDFSLISSNQGGGLNQDEGKEIKIRGIKSRSLEVWTPLRLGERSAEADEDQGHGAWRAEGNYWPPGDWEGGSTRRGKWWSIMLLYCSCNNDQHIHYIWLNHCTCAVYTGLWYIFSPELIFLCVFFCYFLTHILSFLFAFFFCIFFLTFFLVFFFSFFYWHIYLT